MIDSGLKGQIALVTGANHGIGAATSIALAAQGVSVLVHYFRVPTNYTSEELAKAHDENLGSDALYRYHQQRSGDETSAEIRALGVGAAALELDLATDDAARILFDFCQEELGTPDILVNNAAHCVVESFGGEMTPGSVDRHFAINARAPALLMQEFAVRKTGPGRIVNISTDAADCHPGNVSYAASKHALESYTRSAADELGPRGITVNTIAAGPIQTGHARSREQPCG